MLYSGVTAQTINVDTTKLNTPGPSNLDASKINSTLQKTGYEHMRFTIPPSTNRSSSTALYGFFFTYYNEAISKTFSEADNVFGEKRNFDKADFDKYVSKKINQIKKGFKKSETLQLFVEDSLTSSADYISSVYFATEDTNPAVVVNGVHPTLQVRDYHAWIYKKDSAAGKGDAYAIFFSEIGLPKELHSKEEIRFKIQ